MKRTFIIKYRNFNVYSIGIDERVEKTFSGNLNTALKNCIDYFKSKGHSIQGIWTKYGEKNLY